MKELLDIAIKALTDNTGINEIEVFDGSNNVRVIKNAPVIWYYQSPCLGSAFHVKPDPIK